MQNEEQSLPLGSGLLDSGNGSLLMLEEGPSSSVVAPTSIVAADETNDEIDNMLAYFVDEDMLLPDGNGFNQVTFCEGKCVLLHSITDNTMILHASVTFCFIRLLGVCLTM